MSNENIYKRAKELFFEKNSPTDFIAIDSNIIHLEALKSSMSNRFKFILLTGEPGVGKSMLLKRAHYEIADEDIVLIDYPFLSLHDFQQTLSHKLFAKESNLLEKIKSSSKIYTLFLDEVQLYPDELLEYLRLLSDTQKFRFVLTFHTDKDSEKLQQKHFATRTYKMLHMNPPNPKELQIYLQKKLLHASLPELARTIDKKRAKLIHHFTQGNLRQTDKFLITLFDIMDYFYTNHPTKINTNKIPIKYIEMSAIHLGLLDA